jgi:hypothetical protein
LKSHMNWEEMEARRVWEYGIWELRNRYQKWQPIYCVFPLKTLCFYLVLLYSPHFVTENH